MIKDSLLLAKTHEFMVDLKKLFLFMASDRERYYWNLIDLFSFYRSKRQTFIQFMVKEILCCRLHHLPTQLV